MRVTLDVYHYVDSDGNYLGGFAGSVPDGGTVVDSAPAYAQQKWNSETQEWEELPLEIRIELGLEVQA